jgi:serine/threonine protein kinase
MQKINHPNVLHLYDLLESGNNYYLIVDYCDKGDLEKIIQKEYPNGMGLEYALKIL